MQSPGNPIAALGSSGLINSSSLNPSMFTTALASAKAVARASGFCLPLPSIQPMISSKWYWHLFQPRVNCHLVAFLRKLEDLRSQPLELLGRTVGIHAHQMHGLREPFGAVVEHGVE